jgi:polyphosphate kinase
MRRKKDLTQELEKNPSPPPSAILQGVERNGPFEEDELFLNREIAWLAFNERVLGEAENTNTPLLERVKFISIFHSNLDEFFMVRVSSLIRLLEREGSRKNTELDEEELEDTLDEVALKVRQILKRVNFAFFGSILPQVEKQGVFFVPFDNLSKAESEKLESYFEAQIFPVLTPLAIDPAHPFPYLANLSCYLAVTFEEHEETGVPLLAFVEIPSKLPRFLPVEGRGRKRRYVLIDDLIKQFLDRLFPWNKISGAYVFRVTRNLDYQLLETEVKDLMKSIELELKDREQKIVVRLEIEASTPEPLKQRLRTALELDPTDVYEIQGTINPRDYSFLLSMDWPSDLRDLPFNPRLVPRILVKNVFDSIREEDIFLHHPYDSFVCVLRFLNEAAMDPNVLAIKMTLYRTGGDSPIIESLVRAAENGKQVTAVVELKARFDERNNIVWARRLERAGVHVVFGFVGLKTHGKCLLVVRREHGVLRKYVHLSTGNYNSSTAKLYTDIGIITSQEGICNDIASLFNLLTGFNIVKSISGTIKERTPSFEKIKVAPFGLRQFMIGLIDQEKRLHKPDNPGHLILKMNSLTDLKIVQALYKASQKGVKIDLIVRGVCVLRPGIPGISENIRVISIIDRFLEHSRIYYFKHGGNPLFYLGSADLMQRNMDKRIEVLWPVENRNIQIRLISILEIYLRDNCKSHLMLPDGTYKLLGLDEPTKLRCQEKFIEIARKEGLKTVAYDDAVRSLEIIVLSGHSDKAHESKAKNHE